MWESAWLYVADYAGYLLAIPTLPGEKLYWAYCLTFIALAYLSYRLYPARPEGAAPRSRPGFWSYVFPKRIYTHPSAIVDYKVYLANLFIGPVTSAFGVAVQTGLSIQIGNALIALNDGAPIVRGDWSVGVYAVFVLGMTLAADLSVYIIHRWHHANRVLWPIHALHHSAEVMTPVTLFRKHPLWNFSANLLTMVLTGTFQGLFLFAFYGSPGFEVLFGLNALYVVYNFCGANLRHSHIWLSWGKPLSYLFISPAMHQIHHDPRRMRCNYGEIFAVWDWLFGTLYIPEQRETFAIGLGDDGNPHTDLRKAYWVPVRDALRALRAPGDERLRAPR
ncbi:MAG: sterol desaturase family protein [Pseudomonadota bacterium]